MGWQDRQYRPPQDEGGFRRALRRVFESGNFFDLAFPLFRVAGIRVRIHLFFVLYIAIELIRSIDGTQLGPVFTAMRLFTLFSLVLLHEFGHCIACRKVGGEANDIVMWPLGGLAMCVPPHHPRAALITTVGGPAVNLALMPVFAVLLLLVGAPRDVYLFNPFQPYSGIGGLTGSSNLILYAKFALFSAHVMNFYLFCFNVFLPMFPMDGGRIMQELLWFRVGYRRSMQIAVNIGLTAAVLVAIFAFYFRLTESNLVFIAVFCGITCWQERQRLAFMEPETFSSDYGYKSRPIRDRNTGGGGGAATKVRTGPTKAEVKRQQSEQELNAEVDRILEKIRTAGMASLTKKEKATLQGETERKRRESAGG